jgi:lipopolysaccharide transport system ATP-binding protein
MGAVSKLCNKAILLNHGTILESSTPEKIIPRYLSLNKNNSDFIDFENVKEREGNGRVRFKWVEIYSLTNNIRTRDFSLGEDLSIRFCIGNGSVSNAGLPLRMAIELKTSDGIKLATMIDEDSNFHISSFDGNLTVEVILKDLRLYPDTYYLSLYVGDISSRDIYDYLDDCINFEVNDGGKLTTRPLPRSGGLLFYTPAWQRINE